MTANLIVLAALRRRFHAGKHYNPLTAADDKVTLSVVLVNKKPQYLVFCYHSAHPLPKQRQLPVESCKQPCGRRVCDLQIVPNPVHLQLFRPSPATKKSLVLAGARGKRQKRAEICAEQTQKRFSARPASLPPSPLLA
jgi:hypothetical protein